MARATLTELLNRIDDDIQENTAGEITATTVNELLEYLTNNLYLPSTAPVAFGEMNVTTNEANTVTFGAGQTTVDDTLLPITPGTTYFEVPGYSGGIQDGLVYDAASGGLRATIAGTYHFDGWLSCRHTVNNSTVGVVFGIKRDGMIVGTSPRPTPAEMPNADDIGLISGTGLVVLAVDDVIVPLIATQNVGTVTVNNSTLVGKLIKAS